MFILSPLIILFICFVLFIVLSVFVYRQKSHFYRINQMLKTQIETQELFINELQSAQKIVNNQFVDVKDKLKNYYLENEQVSKQLEHRIKKLQKESALQKNLLEQLQNQQPQDKLYSRAFKLVELGADIEEVVRECDIPLAEAEMLISVHRNKTSSS
ncbi:MAG: cell shape-determining protein MreC [Colwellia sp.]|jgi:cell shape-determining protein MreC